ncbi:MAG TPA: BTAD domain-containing putative transcriptional regulator, partial [Herpetosiphonaceae bacterium]|nr:BTAD domain-containing putative transcriptional regulator [Herpetosiphonaceae bacterium]
MLSIVLFGSPHLALDQRPLPLLRRKNRALVYYLAAQPEPVRRERLLLLLWPDLDRPAAQHSLRTLLHGLRQTLGSTLLVTDETLALAPDTEVDVRRLAAGLAQPPGEPHSLEAALALYRGEFLADFSLPDSPAFDDWVVAERERYRQLAIHGLTMLAQLQAARRVWPAALAAITRAVDLDPLREDVQAIAMQLQYFAGDRTGAIRRYEQLRKLLDDELGLPPMAETRAVYDAIITERLPPPMIAPAPAAPEVDAPQPAEPEVLRPTPPPDVALSPGVSAQPQPVVPGAPILATKLFLPPARAALVPRPRLHARLDRGLAGPLTIIAAPAGFGKTTLLAEWLAQLPAGTSIPSGSNATACPPQVAWLSLDAGDSDPIQFLRYLIAALQTVAPTVGSRVLSLLDSAQAPRIESLIPLVINELAALPDPTILVLDDYHVVDAPAVHQALTFLIDHLPPQLHLILATRSDPPLPLARLRARRQLTELRAQDLRFAPEEAEQFLREVMGLALSAADVAALETRTEGWIAGLQLAALFLQDRPREQIAHFIDAFTGSHRFVVDYLVDEVLARQPAHLQTFLLRTSILDRLSGDLCDALVHGDESRGGAGDRRAPAPGASQAVLENLERGNLFIVPLDDTRHWYRYHHLFAQVLRERLQRSVSVDELASLHRRAATWFEGQGFVVETVHHAMAARDWEHAARLIEAHGQLLILRGQVSTVLNWLTILAKPLLRARPHLLFLQGLGLFFVNQMEDAWVHMQAVREALAREPDERSRTIRGYATVNLAANAHFRGDFTTCITLAREALEILPAPDVTGRNSSNVHMASALSLSGDVTPANERRIIG